MRFFSIAFRPKTQRVPYAGALRDTLWLWGALALIIAVLQHRLWAEIPADFAPLTRVFFAVGYAVFCGVLALPAAVLSLIAERFCRRGVFYVAAFVLGGATAVFAYIDSSYYGVYGYHIDGMVLNLLTNSAASDSVTVGGKAFFFTVARAGGIVLAWAALLYGVRRLRAFLRPRFPRLRCSFRLSVCVVAGFAALFLCEKMLFVGCYMRYPGQALRARALLGPLHLTLPAPRLFTQNPPLEDALTKAPEADGGVLATPPHFVFGKRPLGRLPNILILVVESGHASAQRADVMPNTFHLTEDGVFAGLHYSGSNCTRFGFFALFYGLYPTYWDAALEARQGPALIAAARELGYRFCVASSTDLHFPEFRQTVFAEVPPADIHDTQKGEPFQRDEAIADRMIDLVRSNDHRPFFGVAFFDSPHIPYRYPAAAEKFTPALPLEDVDVLAQGVNGDPDCLRALRNRSLNSIAYVDSQIGRIVKALKDTDQYNTTALIVAGDHGQEFCELGVEKGHIGHNGAFTPYQTRTLFAAHIPGAGPLRLQRITSHMDVPATLLPLMGVKNPPETYTQGVSLLQKDDPRRVVFLASWSEAVWTDGDTTVQIGRGLHNRGSIHIFDASWRELPLTSGQLDHFYKAIRASEQARRAFLTSPPDE